MSINLWFEIWKCIVSFFCSPLISVTTFVLLVIVYILACEHEFQTHRAVQVRLLIKPDISTLLMHKMLPLNSSTGQHSNLFSFLEIFQTCFTLSVERRLLWLIGVINIVVVILSLEIFDLIFINIQILFLSTHSNLILLLLILKEFIS